MTAGTPTPQADSGNSTAAAQPGLKRPVDHVFLTRFNLPSKGIESLIRAQEGWLRDRVALFERYTLPSMANQTAEGLYWIVYFDPQSPEWLMRRIAAWTEAGRLTAIFAEEVPTDKLLDDLRQVVGITSPGRAPLTADDLVTTNLDNDDGLAIDFAERIQSAERGDSDAVAVYVVNGLIVAPGGVFLRTDRRNAFCSVRTSWADPKTCWSEWHNRLGAVMPVVEVTGPPGWLQVVHGANVSNRARGRLTRSTDHQARFPELLDDRPDPSTRQLVVDQLVHRPFRTTRDGLRSTAKGIALKLVGKRGLDRIKETLGIARGWVRTARKQI